MTIRIDAEFQALCPPLLPEEREQLEASLLAEGCRDPLMIWLPEDRAWCERCEAEQPIDYFFDMHPYAQASDDRQWMWLCLTCHDPIDEEELEPLVLDGHNRYEICTQRTLEFDVRYQRQIATREEAINWIIATQLGRRNLTPEQKSYLRGKRYNLEKRHDGGHGDQKSEDNLCPPIHEKLAKEYKVSGTTIKNDGHFTTAVDTLEAQVRHDIREVVLRRQDRDKGKITKQQVTKTGKLVQDKAVAAQPFMRRDGWKPYQVLEAIDVLGALPTEEHPAINLLLDQPFIPGDDGLAILKNLQHVPREGRQQIYALHASPDPRDRSDAMTLAARKRPEPDPQIGLAKHLIRALESIREQQRRNWRNKPEYAEEPWIAELDAIDTLLADVQQRWGKIASQAETLWKQRIATYGTTLTT